MPGESVSVLIVISQSRAGASGKLNCRVKGRDWLQPSNALQLFQFKWDTLTCFQIGLFRSLSGLPLGWFTIRIIACSFGEGGVSDSAGLLSQADNWSVGGPCRG